MADLSATKKFLETNAKVMGYIEWYHVMLFMFRFDYICCGAFFQNFEIADDGSLLVVDPSGYKVVFSQA